MQFRWLIAAAAIPLALAGCSLGARQADYSPQRDYSADIAAALNHGPTSAEPGIVGREEPIGALPWDIGQRHQS